MARTLTSSKDDDTVEGGDGVDIIYIKRPMANVNLGSCSQANCAVSDDNSYDGDDPFEPT